MINKFFFLKVFLLLSVAIYLVSCTTDKLPEPGVGAECDNFDATYDGDIKAIIDATCAIPQCHVSGGSGPGVFTDYTGLTIYAHNAPNGLRDRVINLANDPSIGMPPDNSNGPADLTDEQLEIFRCWANAGFPEN